ncbi:MAG: CDP-diacylglycerol--serine O-phosphatidyltransferase [Zoogloeaceae bacterium]|jgi:CDP-diacylglycerol--serine O-phosphatidyltransferase|nr:CDP-diacylglycerol--serine O-phosphatidyltransferase [Zoogloeaceae bacterium]
MSEPTSHKKLLFHPGSRRRGIYILPSLFTTAALFSGFFAIVQAMQGNFEQAAIAIFVAMVMDGLDGRVARLTNTQSAFGAEYDSLADMVSFGVAPALVMYSWALSGLGRIGWLAAFVYCAGAALRLARFNVNLEVMDKRYFQGLPSPAAAAFIVGMVWLSQEMGVVVEEMRWIRWLAAFFTVLIGITMVSNVLFYSFKDINVKKRVPFMTLVALVLAFVLVPIINTAGFLFAVALLYLFSGYLLAVMRFFSRKNRVSKAALLAPPDDSADNDYPADDK